MAPSGQHYKVRLASGRILGPLELEQVRKLIRKNQITGDEDAREYPQGDWVKITTLAELADLFIKRAEAQAQGGEDVTSSPQYKPILGKKVDPMGSTEILPQPGSGDEKAPEPAPPPPAPAATKTIAKTSAKTGLGAGETKTAQAVVTKGSSQEISFEKGPSSNENFLEESSRSGQNFDLDSRLEQEGREKAKKLAQESTIMLQRPAQEASLASKKMKGQIGQAAQIIAIVGAVLYILSEVLTPGNGKLSKTGSWTPIRPRLPTYIEGASNPKLSNELYSQALGSYTSDTPPGYQAAADKLLQAASNDNSNVKAVALLASCYLNLIDSSNKDENYFSVISKLIDLSRAKNLDLPETVIADTEFYITINRADAAESRIVEYTRTHKDFGPEMFFYLAAAYYARADYQSAAKFIQQFPEKSIFSPKIYYLKGQIAEKMNDSNSALEQYGKAVKFNSNHARSRLRIAEILNKRGQLAAAVEHVHFMVSHPSLLAPKDLAQAFYYQTLLNEADGKYDLALGNIERAVRLDHDSSDYNLEMYTLLARAGEAVPAIQREAKMYFFLGEGEKLVLRGDFQAALLKFLEAREANIDSTIPLIKMGDMFIYLHNLVSARLNYQKAAEKAPQNIQIWSKYIDVLIQSFEWEEAQKAMDRFRRLPVPQSGIDKAAADYYEKQGRHVEAQIFYRKAMARDTIDSGVYINYAKSLMATRNFKDATFFFALALRLDPLNVDAIIGTAKCTAELEGIDRATGMIQDQLTKSGSPRAELLSAIADLEIQRGQWDRAQDFVTQAKQANPDLAIPWKLQAQIYLNSEGLDKKALDNALEAYRSFSDRNPADPSGYIERYRIFIKKTQFEQAEDELNKVYEIYPKYPNIHYYRGLLYGVEGNHKVAVEEFNKELQNNPQSVPTMLALGKELVSLGDVKGALGHFNKAMQLAPGASEPKHQSGYANLLLKNYPGAIALLSEAQKLDRGNPLIYKRLGLAYLESGDITEARKNFRKYLEVEPEAPDKAEFEKYL